MENLLNVTYLGFSLSELGKASLILIMFTMGTTLKVSDFTRVFVQPRAILIGLIMQALFLPAYAFLISWGLDLHHAIAVGLVILSVSPGGAPSNLFTYLAYGDIALSVSMTAISGFITLISIPVLVNLALFVFSVDGEIARLPVLPTIYQVFILTALPVISGMLIHRYFPELSKNWSKRLSIIGLVMLLLIFVLFCHAMWGNILYLIKTAGGVALLMNLSGLAIGYYVAFASGLPAPQCRTIAIGVGLQNCLMGFVIAFVLLKNPALASVSLAYLLVMMVTIPIYTGLTHFYLKKKGDKSLVEVTTNS